MKTIEEARRLLQSEEFMHIAAVLGGGEDLAEAYRNRLLCAIDSFVQLYGSGREIAIFSAPGRTELGGNHTDHQHGHVLAASINLDVIAVVARREDTTIRVHSEGFPEDEISLEELEPVTDKKPTAAELIRGIAARFKQYGCPLETGFDAYTTSQVMAGSGLSSSAAFEVLLGNICNALYAENRFTPVELAQMGQYAENVYFQKPCGLMDQMASSVGGAVAIDFANPMLPAVHPVAFDFSRTGYVLCIVDTGGNHADLTAEYAAIPAEMQEVAKYFGKDVLAEVPPAQVLRSIPELRKACGDRAVLRAMHFYREDGRAQGESDALDRGDFEAFLHLV
ncbi:galactokinase family protein, partial [Ruminococcus callidus]